MVVSDMWAVLQDLMDRKNRRNLGIQIQLLPLMTEKKENQLRKQVRWRKPREFDAHVTNSRRSQQKKIVQWIL